MSLLEKYNALNSSFTKKTLIFHLGKDAGFFSEYNNMILAMLYCLENKIKFVLYSGDANFKYDKGWVDYFLPFCEEIDNRFHARYNFRAPGIFKKLRPQVILYHLFNRDVLLTFEIMNQVWKRKLDTKRFSIPELGIDGSLRDACRMLADLTWHYNQQINDEITQLITSLQLPEHYIGFHIRSGDKILEHDLRKVSEYIQVLHNINANECKTIFVLTDNYLLVDELQEQLKDWQIYTLCEKEERGYFHQEFSRRDSQFVRKSLLKLFASVDILSKSCIFLGTFTSNPDAFLGMRMPSEKMFCVDTIPWRI
ncbi:hypothetical protein AGMMS49982_21380 [Bacteroidia bacterium]|nr:hypothetical protein AGMMS49982_21380 [Bacteroidia bacterium]